MGKFQKRKKGEEIFHAGYAGLLKRAQHIQAEILQGSLRGLGRGEPCKAKKRKGIRKGAGFSAADKTCAGTCKESDTR